MKLKPCPFCGSDAAFIQKGNDSTRSRWITVKCTNKDCRVQTTVGAIRNDVAWCEHQAADIWNRRMEDNAKAER